MSRAQRFVIIAGLILAPIMIVLFLAFGRDTRKVDCCQQRPSVIGAGLAPGMKVLEIPSGVGSGSARGLDFGGSGSNPAGWQHVAFLNEPGVEGVGFNDDAGVTQGAVVCDDDDKASNRGKGRMWTLIADNLASDIRDEGDRFLVDGRIVAKKLSLDLDGHVFAATDLSITTSTKGRTMLTGLFDADEKFYAVFKNAGHMELASSERTLIMNTSGNEAKLTDVAGQCASLGTPF